MGHFRDEYLLADSIRCLLQGPSNTRGNKPFAVECLAIGQLLFIAVCSSDLWIGATMADFKSFGSLPSLIEALIVFI